MTYGTDQRSGESGGSRSRPRGPLTTALIRGRSRGTGLGVYFNVSHGLVRGNRKLRLKWRGILLPKRPTPTCSFLRSTEPPTCLPTYSFVVDLFQGIRTGRRSSDLRLIRGGRRETVALYTLTFPRKREKGGVGGCLKVFWFLFVINK